MMNKPEDSSRTTDRNMSSAVVSLARLELNPSRSGKSKIDLSRGRRISPSMMTTLALVWARLIALLTAVVVLPSPGRLEVTSKVFGARPAVESRTEVLSWRYASASADRPLMFRSNSGLFPLLPFRFWRDAADDSKRRGADAELIAGMTASAGKR